MQRVESSGCRGTSLRGDGVEPGFCCSIICILTTPHCMAWHPPARSVIRGLGHTCLDPIGPASDESITDADSMCDADMPDGGTTAGHYSAEYITCRSTGLIDRRDQPELRPTLIKPKLISRCLPPAAQPASSTGPGPGSGSPARAEPRHIPDLIQDLLQPFLLFALAVPLQAVGSARPLE